MKRLCGPAMVVALMAVAGGASSHACTPTEGRCFRHRSVAHSDVRTWRDEDITTRAGREVETVVERPTAKESAGGAGDGGGEPP